MAAPAAIVPLFDARPQPRRVAVGTFDGVHRGHREVIAGADTVLTFDRHPLSVTAPQRVPKILTTLERKAELVGELGVAELVVISFDADFRALTAQEFVDRILVGQLGATHVSVGENFHFGRGAQGTADMLAADTRFQTRVVPLLEVDGEVVSSSHIRGLIQGGAVHYANELLGAPFVIDGPVEHGEKRGRTLGFPTANLVPDERMTTPAYGVYACCVRAADGVWRQAATSIGVRPQFETGLGELIEAYVLDFEGDLYGQPLRVEFHRRLRGEKRFDDLDGLLEQMHADVEDTRRLLPCSPA